MSLNIKNQRVHDLARQAAAATGRSQTSVIELLSSGSSVSRASTPRRRRRPLVSMSPAQSAEYRADPGRTDRQIRVVEDLYDAHTGLPR